MSTEPKGLEDLIIAAAQENNDAAVAKLLVKVRNSDPQSLKDAAANFEFLFESWGDSISKYDDKANTCVVLAEASALDSQTFRNALYDAVRKLLPPYILSPGVIKAVGARDQAVAVRDAAARLRKLQKIKFGALVYQSDSQTWGKVTNIDKVTSTIAVNTLSNGSLISLPVTSAISNSYFFDPNIEMMNLLHMSKHSLKHSAHCRQALAKHSLSDISESKIRDILTRILVPEQMSVEAFNEWYEKETVVHKATTAQRGFQDARSILELHTLLKAATENGTAVINEESAAKLKKLFSGMKPSMGAKDTEMLAESIAQLTDAGTGSLLLRETFAPLRGKTPFWPAEVSASIDLKRLEVWGRLSIKLLTPFVKASALLYTGEELAAFAMSLPLRCVSAVFEALQPNEIRAAIMNTKNISSDILLWIWKNRTSLSPVITNNVDMKNVAAALSMEGLPKEWTAAQRELKKLLFDKADFQKFLIENADGDIPSIIASMQKIKNLAPGECQSLMVKLARHSDELREHIESGEGKKIMGAQGADKAAAQAPITSISSYKRLTEELNNIVSVQIPENVKAIEHARGFGDFRENAEYDAAKERRRFLHRRRSELEHQLNTVQPSDFRNVVVTDRVVLGSTVALEGKDGKLTEYHMVGAHDGDPDNNCISYMTKFGTAVLGAKIGADVTLPDGTAAKIKNVKPLSEALRKRLAAE